MPWPLPCSRHQGNWEAKLLDILPIRSLERGTFHRPLGTLNITIEISRILRRRGEAKSSFSPMFLVVANIALQPLEGVRKTKEVEGSPSPNHTLWHHLQSNIRCGSHIQVVNRLEWEGGVLLRIILNPNQVNNWEIWYHIESEPYEPLNFIFWTWGIKTWAASQVFTNTFKKDIIILALVSARKKHPEMAREEPSWLCSLLMSKDICSIHWPWRLLRTNGRRNMGGHDKGWNRESRQRELVLLLPKY